MFVFMVEVLSKKRNGQTVTIRLLPIFFDIYDRKTAAITINYYFLWFLP